MHLLLFHEIQMINYLFINKNNFIIMKNYAKLIVAVFGITAATFGSIADATANGMNDLKKNDNVKCVTGTDHCGYTSDCHPIVGKIEKY